MYHHDIHNISQLAEACEIDCVPGHCRVGALTFCLPERAAPLGILNYIGGIMKSNPAVTCMKFRAARQLVRLLRRSSPPELDLTWAVLAVTTPRHDNMMEKCSGHN